jgi:two-component system response regulator RegA
VDRRAIGNVLLVDDDETLLASWRRSIAREHRVSTTTDPVVARRLFQEHEFDLAVVDLRLGTSSGLDLIVALKQARPSTVIVVCSGYLSVESAVACVRAGADIVVFKPITFREILHKIERHHQEGVPLTELRETPTLAQAQSEHIARVLADCNGYVSAAARRLGMYRSSLQRLLRRSTRQSK